MPDVTPGSTIKSLADVAWLAARVGRQLIAARAEISPDAIRSFWQSTRALQRRWSQRLDDWSAATDPELLGLEEIASQLFMTELAVRVWSTVLAGIDAQAGKTDLTRIARNVVRGLLQIRHRVLSHVLTSAVVSESRAAGIDRIRRRCDRWTDLLIGHITGQEGRFEFAFDPERARDFAEERAEQAADSINAIDHLVSAGLRLAFIGQLPDVVLDHPAFDRMKQSIVANLSHARFRPDGTFDPMDVTSGADPQSVEETLQELSPRDVLLPGISFAALRRRFRKN